MKDVDGCIILSTFIKHMLYERKYENVYKNFFSQYNKHYDLENISGYDIDEIACLVTNHKDNLYELIDTKTDLDAIITFVSFCDAYIFYIGE